jgi:hypothetical protein
MRLAVVAAIALASGCTRESGSPRVFLWAGERTEDLRFLEPGRYGIAYFAGRVRIDNNKVTAEPSHDPLYLPLRATLHGVVRIEADVEAITANLAAPAASEILKLTGKPHVTGVQLHVEDSPAQRDFYRRLIANLRAALPKGHKLTIAAKPSWCTDDPWIEGLPVDEAIPMLFDPNPPRAEQDFPVPICRHSFGLSAELPDRYPHSERTRYYRNSRPWDAAAVAALRQ